VFSKQAHKERGVVCVCVLVLEVCCAGRNRVASGGRSAAAKTNRRRRRRRVGLVVMLFLQRLAHFLAASMSNINTEPARSVRDQEVDHSGGLSCLNPSPPARPEVRFIIAPYQGGDAQRPVQLWVACRAAPRLAPIDRHA
jgi:hypothetical protein